jgi:hypothetical protein
MALWLSGEQRVKVNKIVEEKDNFTVAHLSSSRKDGEKYVYSDWGFVRFVGGAHKYFSSNVSEKDVLTLKKAYFTKESYEKDGETLRPKNPQLVVFECEVYRSGGNKSSAKKSVEVPPEDDIPF